MTSPIRAPARGRWARVAAGCACGILRWAEALADSENIGGGVGVASAQTHWGISPSAGKPALLGDVYMRLGSGWQASLGAARWAPAPGRASGEWTLALSHNRQLDEDWSVAATASHYGRLGGQPARRVDYDELSASLSWRGRFQLLLAVSPNTTAADGNGGFGTGRSATVELSWHEHLAGRWSADAGIGHYDLSPIGRPGYSYASVGLSYGAGPFLASLGYVTNHNVPLSVPPEVRRSRWLLSLWWSY